MARLRSVASFGMVFFGALFVMRSFCVVAVLDADQDLVTSLGLNLREQIAQMCQMDVQGGLMRSDDPYVLNDTAVEELLGAGGGNVSLGSLLNSPTSGGGSPPSIDQWRAIQQRVFNLSSSVGSRVPLLYGLDSVHGANYILGATLFPQQIGTAATFNRTHAFIAGVVTGRETRYAGIPWVFSPILGIAVQPSWPRVFETFGEDPFLASEMGVNIVRGLQSPLNGSWLYTVAACLKHYIGYPNPRTGHDRTPSWIPLNHLMQYFAPSFFAAISRGDALSIMENYVEVNGRPTVANNLLLQFLLREVHGFRGMLVTDYNEIFNLVSFHETATTYHEAMAMSIGETSIDMGMAGNSKPHLMADLLADLVASGNLSADRIKASANRVLNLKRRLGLLSGVSPVPPQQPSDLNASGCLFGCVWHHDAALQSVRDSLVLLQNADNTLPLPSNPIPAATTIALIGPACDNVGLMAGGWTVHWQGTANDTYYPYGTTIRHELVKRYGAGRVTYVQGCSVLEGASCEEATIAAAVAAARNATLAIVCIGERHYAEKPGDIDELALPGQQEEMFARIAQANNNTVVVLVEGRPRLLGSIPSLASAILHAFLPGPFGGRAVVEALHGDFNPGGKLPLTYPLTPGNSPIQYWRKYSANTDAFGPFPDYAVQWTFGHGLSYTTFAVTLTTVSIIANNTDVATDATELVGPYVFVTAEVINIGTRDGTEVVFVYTTQPGRPISSEVLMLRAFEKVAVPAGGRLLVNLSFPVAALAYYDESNCPRLDILHPVFVTVNATDMSNASRAAVQLPSGTFSGNCTLWAMRATQEAGYTPPQPTPRRPEPPLRPVNGGEAIGLFIAGGAVAVVCHGIYYLWMRRRAAREGEFVNLLSRVE